MEIQPLASQVEVTRSYLAKIELGHSVRVSPKVFLALLNALGIKDRRALLANPHGALIRKSMVSGQAAASRRSRDTSCGLLRVRRRVRG